MHGEKAVIIVGRCIAQVHAPSAPLPPSLSLSPLFPDKTCPTAARKKRKKREEKIRTPAQYIQKTPITTGRDYEHQSHLDKNFINYKH